MEILMLAWLLKELKVYETVKIPSNIRVYKARYLWPTLVVPERTKKWQILPIAVKFKR